MPSYDAYLLRENTNTSGLELTARTVVELLARFETPHFIVGGYAVQEHGYPRLTIDLDVVVPDVLDAIEILLSDLTGPFRRSKDWHDRLVDSRNNIPIDFLPAGGVLNAACKVPFPVPIEVWDSPQLVSLEQLISLKLDSWSNKPLKRSQDQSDVIQLITRRKLPRDFPIVPAVRDLYLQIWDGLQAEK